MFDLHSHSYYSDGSDSPEAVLKLAKQAGADLFALTDHDCSAGIPEAVKYAGEISLNFLPGIEIQAEYPEKLHILGLGMDIEDPRFVKLTEKLQIYREERNRNLDKRLKELGMDVSGVLKEGIFCTSRVNYAQALVEMGFAADISDAFRRIIGKNGTAAVSCRHPSMEEVLNTVRKAGGIAVLAHPMNMKCDHDALIAELKQLGLWGIEAYYYSASKEETQFFSSLAAKNGLYITCGSDYHGKRRPLASIGCCYEDSDVLKRTREEINRLYGV